MFIYDKMSNEADVIECYEHNDSIYAILSETVFYPEGGGQISDIGLIGDASVLSVFKYDNKIVHEIDQKVSGRVVCSVDEKYRYKNSRLHSAQHLLSAVFEANGYDTTSFSMKANSFTIDIVKKVSREEIDENENQINQLIRKQLPIKSRSYEPSIDSDVDVSGYEFDISDIRIVEIEGLEKNVCGGTHVSNTSEIEYLKVIGFKYSGEKTRIDVLIGDDAINYVNECFNEYNKIVKLINQNKLDSYTYIENKLKENKKLAKQVSKLEKRIQS